MEENKRVELTGGCGNPGRRSEGLSGWRFSDCEDFDHTPRGARHRLENPQHRPMETHKPQAQTLRPGHRAGNPVREYNAGCSVTSNRKLGGQNECNTCHNCKDADTACARGHVSNVEWLLC